MSANRKAIFKVGFSRVILTAALFLLVPSKPSMIIGTGKSLQPVWEIDLSKLGYQGRPPIPVGRADTWGFWTYQQGVVFTEPNVIAAFFVVHDDRSGATSVRSKPSPSDPYHLVAVFLNAERGELIRKFDSPLPISNQSVSDVFFFPASKGRFIVGIGNTLSLYSPDSKLLARYDSHAELNAMASPAGDTILVQDTQQVEGEWTSRFDLLDTDQLAVRESWKDHPRPNQFSWGDELAWISQRSLYLKTPDTAPKQLIESKKEFCGYWSFINKDTIAVLECGGGEKLLLVSTDGEIIREFDLGLEQMDGPAIASRNGRRFAVSTYKWGSARNINPEALIARVFSLDTERPLLTVDVAPHYGGGENFHTPRGDTRFGWGGLALSPDGQLLAIKSGPIVQLYHLPQPRGLSLCSANCNDESGAANSHRVAAQAAPALPTPTPPPSQLVRQVLSWLPADTETVIAANGPFLLPELKPEAHELQGREEPDHEVEDTFKGLPLGLLGFKDGLLEKHLKGQKILLAVEGSRHFRSPSDLGEAPFEGCAIAIFAADITDRANSFMKDSSSVALRVEDVEGHKVTVFQETLEKDVWTTFVAFPKPNIAVVASNEGYLQEMLAKLNGKGSGGALPDTLLEWKYVNVQAAFWAVRHYDKKGAAEDPTSPFGGRKAANLPDDHAIGLTFNFDPGKSKTATITYLSGDENILQNVQKNLFPIESEPGARELHIRYNQIRPGTVEGSYDLTHIESAELFAFVLEALLGHAVYL